MSLQATKTKKPHTIISLEKYMNWSIIVLAVIMQTKLATLINKFLDFLSFLNQKVNENKTWTRIAALVCFLNLNSFRAVIALNPVCNVIADNRIRK